MFAVPLARSLFRFDVSGREHIPRHRPYIVIANHMGWVDWAALLLLFPAEPRVHFLADPEGLVKRPVEWFIVRRTGGYVPVDRDRHGDPALYRHVYRCLNLGGAVAIFPEGSYGREGEVRPFKRGFAHFAIRTGVQVVPVALAGTERVWAGKRIRVRIGQPIDPSGLEPEALAELGRQRVAELLPPAAEPAGQKPLADWLTHLF